MNILVYKYGFLRLDKVEDAEAFTNGDVFFNDEYKLTPIDIKDIKKRKYKSKIPLVKAVYLVKDRKGQIKIVAKGKRQKMQSIIIGERL